MTGLSTPPPPLGELEPTVRAIPSGTFVKVAAAPAPVHGSLLQLPVHARIRLLMLYFLPFALFWFLGAVALMLRPGWAPFLQPDLMPLVTVLLGVQALVVAVLAGLGGWPALAEPKPARWLEVSLLHWFGLISLLIFVFVGPWTTPFPVLLVSFPILGLLFFDGARVLRVMGSWMLVWLLYVVAQQAGWAPYAPLLVGSPIVDGRIHGTWLVVSMVTSLGMSLASVWAFVHVRTEQERLQSTLDQMAKTDALTGLANRRSVSMALMAAVKEHAEREAAVVLFDVDHFKQINDTRGHAAGDAVLRVIGQVLLALQDGGMPLAGRIGGEEFVVLVVARPGAELQSVVELLRRSVQREVSARLRVDEGVDLDLAWSAGATVLRADDTVETMLYRADMALMEAKVERNCLVWRAAGHAQAKP
jgi:diguanylate cyclase (GGDEF)-like protein